MKIFYFLLKFYKCLTVLEKCEEWEQTVKGSVYNFEPLSTHDTSITNTILPDIILFYI